MISRQFAAALLDFAEHTAYHRAQSLLHDFIVWDQAVGRIIAHAALGGDGARAGQAIIRQKPRIARD